MGFYFVDYENVNTYGLNGITRLEEDDLVVIFYSEKADTLTFGLHRRLNECRAQVRFQRVMAGTKNALDFQLSSYLGYLICENMGKGAAYYIVSNDRGYEVLSTYWKRQGVDVYLVKDISMRHGKDPGNKTAPAPSKGTEAAPPAVPPETVERQLSAILPEAGMVPAAAELIRDSATKQDVYLGLWGILRADPEDPELFKLYRAVQVLIADKPSALEPALERILPDPGLVPAVARIVRGCRTRREVRDALDREGLPESGDRSPEAVYRTILPLIAAKSGQPARRDSVPVREEDDLERKLTGLLPDRTQVPTVAALIRTHGARGEINNALMAAYRPRPGDKTVSEIYKAIQPLIADLPGTVPPSGTQTDSAPAAAVPQTAGDGLEGRLEELLPDRRQVPVVAAILRDCGTRQDISAALDRAFRPGPGDRTVSEIYKAIQPLIADLPGSGGTKSGKLERQLAELLSDREKVPTVAKIIRNCMTKQEIHTALSKTWPSAEDQTAGEIYRAIKPLLSGKR